MMTSHDPFRRGQSRGIFEIGFKVALFALMPSSGIAAEFAYGIGYLGEYSDNIERAAGDGTHETVNTFLLGAVFRETTSDLTARLSAQGEYRRYYHGMYEDETRLGAAAYLLWYLSPQRLSWTLEDVLRNVPIESTGGDIPSNRTNVNSFSTGPDLTIRFNPTNSVLLGARYGNVLFDLEPNNYHRLLGYARWLYRSSAVTTYSANGEYSRVDFSDEARNENYDRLNLFMRAAIRPSRSEFVLDLGKTRIDRDRSQQIEGDVARVSWIYQLTSDSTAGVSASREFSDTGADLLSGLERLDAAAQAAAEQPGPLPIVVTADIYYANRHDVFYRYRSAISTVYFRGFRREVDFEISQDDRVEDGGRFEMEYALSGRTAFSASYDYVRADYLITGQLDVERSGGVRMRYRVSPVVSLSLELRHTNRESSIALNEYTERRLLFGLSYSSAPLFSARSPR